MKKEFEHIQKGLQIYGWSTALRRLVSVMQLEEPDWYNGEKNQDAHFPIYVEVFGTLGDRMELGELIKLAENLKKDNESLNSLNDQLVTEKRHQMDRKSLDIFYKKLPWFVRLFMKNPNL